MPDLEELCRQLAEGSTGQKRRAWRALVRDGELWRSCQAAVAAPAGVAMLAGSYRRLQEGWAREPLLEAAQGNGAVVEEAIDVAARIVAAAAAAAVALGAGERDLVPHWCARAAGLPGDPPAALPESLVTGEPLLRAAFRSLDLPADRPDEVAAAQDAALSFVRSTSGDGAA